MKISISLKISYFNFNMINIILLFISVMTGLFNIFMPTFNIHIELINYTY